MPGIGGAGLNIKKIPLLYQGGVLEKGQTAFLEGNGAEAVVPLHNNRKWIEAVANDMNETLSNHVNVRANANYNIEKIDQLIEVVEEILAKPTDIYMDRIKVGQAMAETNDNISGQRVNFRNRGVIL